MAARVHECRCGARYRITSHDIIMRDKDSIECEVCGATIERWNGGVVYAAQRLPDEEKGSRSSD